MTDARFPERWLNDRRVMRLSDAGFRLFVTSLTWSVSNRTEGALYDDDLPLLPRADRGCTDELVKTGLWQRDRDRWLIADFAATQTTAAEMDQLERARIAERQKKARQRARTRRNTAVPGDVPGDVSPDNTGQDRPGQARTGGLEVSSQEQDVPNPAEHGGDSSSWPGVNRPPDYPEGTS